MIYSNSAASQAYAGVQAVVALLAHAFGLLSIAVLTPTFSWADVIRSAPIICLDVLCGWTVGLVFARLSVANLTTEDVVSLTIIFSVLAFLVLRICISKTSLCAEWAGAYAAWVERFDPRQRNPFSDSWVPLSIWYFAPLLVWPAMATFGGKAWRLLVRVKRASRPCHKQRRAHRESGSEAAR